MPPLPSNDVEREGSVSGQPSEPSRMALLTSINTHKKLTAGLLVAIALVVSGAALVIGQQKVRPIISWSEPELTVFAPPAEARVITVSFRSTETLRNVTPFLTSSLSNVVSVEPKQFGTIQAHQQVAVILRIRMPSVPEVKVDGTLHIRSSSGTSATHAVPLKLTLFSTSGNTSLGHQVITSSRIVTATVAQMMARQVSSAPGIWTFLELQSVGDVKGPQQLRTPVIVKIPGGRMGSEVVLARSSPTISQHDRVVLFLTGPDTDGTYRLKGGALGVFHVTVGPSGGDIAVVDRGYRHRETIVPLSDSLQGLLNRSESGDLSLQELFAAIESYR